MVIGVFYAVGFLGSLAALYMSPNQSIQKQKSIQNNYGSIRSLNNMNIRSLNNMNILSQIYKRGGNAKLIATSYEQSFQISQPQKQIFRQQILNYQTKNPRQVLLQISKNFQKLNQKQIMLYIQQRLYSNVYLKQYVIKQKMIQITNQLFLKSNKFLYDQQSYQQQLKKLQLEFNKLKQNDPYLSYKDQIIKDFEQYKNIVFNGMSNYTNQLKQILKYSISPNGIRTFQTSMKAGQSILQDFFNPSTWLSATVNLAYQTTYATTALTLTGLLLGDVFPISQRIYQSFVDMSKSMYYGTVPIIFLDSKTMPEVKMFYELMKQVGFDNCRTIILHGVKTCLISSSLKINSIFTINEIQNQFLLAINIPLLYSAMSQQNPDTNQWILTTLQNIQKNGLNIIAQMIGQNIFNSQTTPLNQMMSNSLWQNIKDQFGGFFQIPILGRQTWRSYYDKKNNGLIQYLKISSKTLLNYTYNNFKTLSTTLYASYQAFWNLVTFSNQNNNYLYKGLLVASGSLILVYKSSFDKALSFIKFVVKLMFFPLYLPLRYLIWPLIQNFKFNKNKKYDMRIGDIEIKAQKYNNQKIIIQKKMTNKVVNITQKWSEGLQKKRAQLKSNFFLTQKYTQIQTEQCDKQSTINKKIDKYIQGTNQNNDKLNKFKQILMAKLQIDKKNLIEKLRNNQGLLFPFIFSTKDLPQPIQQALFCLKNNISLQKMNTIPKQISSKQGIKIIYNCIKNGGNQITKLFKAFGQSKIGNLIFDKGISLDAQSIKSLKQLFYKLKVYGQYLINFQYLQKCAIRTTKDANYVYYISSCPSIRFSLVDGNLYIYEQKNSKLQIVSPQQFNNQFLRRLAMNRLNEQSASLINSLNKTLKNYKTQKLFKQWLKQSDAKELPIF